ncbi:MAG: serine hydroxymethyltransferase, partial [Candidatus Beckwithbacteria bacterium]|nr:serine hydroxymethyltransferase [Candidatus Beckwithbacteria bacterium]
KEKQRQKDQLQLIPSENYASAAVMKAVGSVLMNKYAEGYPHKRYYQGNVNLDAVEDLCRERILKAFGLDPKKWGVNVQPYSGSPANLAVYNALLEPGDKMMGMYLPDGGHLTHGWHLPASVPGGPYRPISITSKFYISDFYHVNKQTQVFDYDQIETQAKKFKPQIIISGGTAYPRTINHKRLGQIATSVGAYYLADIAHEAGLIAAKVHPSPFPWCDVCTFTTHKTFRGPRGAAIIARKELMDKINFSVFPGLQGGPHLHTIAGISVAAAELMTPAFKRYAKQIIMNAQTLAKDLIKGGLTIVSGGTDKHLVLVDLRPQHLTGWTVAWALETANIIANRNTVPYDTASPYYPSGLRLGTPAITTRGMKVKEIKQIAAWVLAVVNYLKTKDFPRDKKMIQADPWLRSVGREVSRFARRFPMPGL